RIPQHTISYHHPTPPHLHTPSLHDALPILPNNLTLGEAAAAIGVSPDTLRRWDRAGKLQTNRDERNRRMVSVDEVRRLSRRRQQDRKSTRLNSSHRTISYAVFCLKKKNEI